MVFDNIVRQPKQYPRCEEDLGLLATAVNYYAEMRTQMRLLGSLCSKLQHTTAVFLQLAQSYIRHGSSMKSPSNIATTSRRSKGRGPEEGVIQPRDNLIDVDLGDHDFATYLNWLPIDMNDTSRILEAELQVPKYHHSHHREENSPSYPQKPISDGTFDWFLWDDYYGSPTAGL